jgi:hypothetical protein
VKQKGTGAEPREGEKASSNDVERKKEEKMSSLGARGKERER